MYDLLKYFITGLNFHTLLNTISICPHRALTCWFTCVLFGFGIAVGYADGMTVYDKRCTLYEQES